MPRKLVITKFESGVVVQYKNNIRFMLCVIIIGVVCGMYVGITNDTLVQINDIKKAKFVSMFFAYFLPIFIVWFNIFGIFSYLVVCVVLFFKVFEMMYIYVVVFRSMGFVGGIVKILPTFIQNIIFLFLLYVVCLMCLENIQKIKKKKFDVRNYFAKFVVFSGVCAVLSAINYLVL